MELDQVPRYQTDAAVKQRQITPEWSHMWQILKLIPKAPLIDIACAEGFCVWMADKAGFTQTLGVEIDEGRVLRGRKFLGDVNLRANNIFDRLSLLKEYRYFIIARFFHNIGDEMSEKLMNEIDKKKNYLLIIKHKAGPRKETGAKREPLATRKGINTFLDRYPLSKKSFCGDLIVAGKGKYSNIPAFLRKHMPEPV